MELLQQFAVFGGHVVRPGLFIRECDVKGHQGTLGVSFREMVERSRVADDAPCPEHCGIYGEAVDPVVNMEDRFGCDISKVTNPIFGDVTPPPSARCI